MLVGAKLAKYAVLKLSDDIILCPRAQNDLRAYLNLLEKYLSVAPGLIDIDPLLSLPTL